MLGERIRKCRQEHGLSLRDLAQRAGVSPSFLSQVEQDQCSPSLASLQRIATALEVPMFHFLDEPPQESPSPVIRASDRPKLFFRDSSIGYELLTKDLGGQMMGMIIRVQPGARRVAAPLAKPTEQWMFVLQGRLEIAVNGNTYLLQQGDTISYAGESLREFACAGSEELVVVCCIAPPVL